MVQWAVVQFLFLAVLCLRGSASLRFPLLALKVLLPLVGPLRLFSQIPWTRGWTLGFPGGGLTREFRRSLVGALVVRVFPMWRGRGEISGFRAGGLIFGPGRRMFLFRE